MGVIVVVIGVQCVLPEVQRDGEHVIMRIGCLALAGAAAFFSLLLVDKVSF